MSASAQSVSEIKRGTLKVHVKVHGTVRAEEVFRIKSSIDGRVETVDVEPHSWVDPDKNIGAVLHREFAALMDSKQSTPSDIMEDRWQRVYKPTPIRCPRKCFVLKIFARPSRWVRAGTLLAEAAYKLRLVGRVRPGDTHWIRKGQLVTYWDKNRPRQKVQGRVEHFVIDVQGERVEPGGTFTILLKDKHYLDPGTEWEGIIEALVRNEVLRVPTTALIKHEGETFLPVRVSTGITTYDETEITAGVSERTRFLIMDPEKLGDIEMHRPVPQTGKIKETKRKRRKRRARPRHSSPGTRTRPPERKTRKRRRRRDSNLEPEAPKRQRARPIDGFPEDTEVKDDPFPSDIDFD